MSTVKKTASNAVIMTQADKTPKICLGIEEFPKV
jgi:hypothetical protein